MPKNAWLEHMGGRPLGCLYIIRTKRAKRPQDGLRSLRKPRSLAMTTIIYLSNGPGGRMRPEARRDKMKAQYLLIAIAGIYYPSSLMAQVSMPVLKSCLEIEDESKERLNCYDAKITP